MSLTGEAPWDTIHTVVSDTAEIYGLLDGESRSVVASGLNIPAGRFIRVTLNGGITFLEATVTAVGTETKTVLSPTSHGTAENGVTTLAFRRIVGGSFTTELSGDKMTFYQDNFTTPSPTDISNFDRFTTTGNPTTDGRSTGLGGILRTQYLAHWGAKSGGHCNTIGELANQGLWGFYWSDKEQNSTNANGLYFATTEANNQVVTNPQLGQFKYHGFTLRCVKTQ
jgi:hypothetical protein